MNAPSRLSVVAGFAAIYVIWGSTYLAIRLGVETIPPFLLAGVRFLAGGTMLYLWAISRGAGQPRPRHWISAAVLGFLMPAVATGLVTYAEVIVPSGLTALLIAITPLWIVLIDWLRPRGVRPSWIVAGGLVLGFAGVAMLINPSDLGAASEINKFGAGLLIIATISWALGSVYSRHADQPPSKLLGAGMQMLVAGVLLVVVSSASGELGQFQFASVTTGSLISLAYLAVFGSIAYGVYVWLLKVSTPEKAATYAYVNPVIALVLGNLVAGESLSGWTLLCSAVILLAVVLIITARRRPVAVLPPSNSEDSSSDITPVPKPLRKCGS